MLLEAAVESTPPDDTHCCWKTGGNLIVSIIEESMRKAQYIAAPSKNIRNLKRLPLASASIERSLTARITGV
ncbi:hypothetical protein AXF42_Ash011387 [Apostasia shenzhenica]|uniref:Uncharacterized protein n=1 Tax=Apostasia shenzhenica TaxID=1088818 RepID=A0A2I0AED2_9ASPA|nr:hypothetical protein AXF42_Ash011387 [Apostasia shenzhenica]